MRSSRHQAMKCDVCVIGGGPAGMMAAVFAAERGLSVVILERNPFLGKKLNITGKGRCNLTNNCDVREVVANIPRGGKFLYSALSAFPPSAVMEWFTAHGLQLKTERGNRVFPESDRARDITDTLTRAIKEANVRIVHARVRELLVKDGSVYGVEHNGGALDCKGVILATGGLSYPLTGSTGDGYNLASAAGHTVTPTRASIVPLTSDDAFCNDLSGLTLRNVKVSAFTGDGKSVYSDFGELLFTHFGISGPVTLSMSAHLNDFKKNDYHVTIDLKPALDEAKLDVRILRDFEQSKNKSLQNALVDLLPRAMIVPVLTQAGLDGEAPANTVTRVERRKLAETLKTFRIRITGTRPIDEAVITSGGVSTDEINPKTMASKLVRGLSFAGEIIDADAYTGGFNLQIAWSTGRAAGLHILEE